MPATLRILALGDSYSIGEGVDAEVSYPNQLFRKLQEKNTNPEKPIIIAKTGWTTSDLLKAIEANPPKGSFNLVFLLIGVNNQYQGRSIQEYRKEFGKLADLAIAFAAGNKNSVYILSIPDYSYTPFASNMDREKIASELQIFNQVNREEAEKKGLNYINITDLTRGGLKDLSLLAEDKLHPSGKMYEFWIDRILQKLNLPS